MINTSDHTTDATDIEVSTWLPVSTDEAFALVTEPRRLRRWLIVAGTIDLRVGGPIRLTVAPGASAVGEVTEVEPGRRFAYTHGWLGYDQLPPGSSTVVVTLDPRDEGTTVTVCHRGLPKSEAAGMQEGWSEFMGALDRAAAGGVGGPDWPEEQETSSSAAVMESTLATLLTVLRQVAPDQGGLATPCPEFDVNGLVEHVLSNGTMLSDTLDLGTTPASGSDLEDRVAAAVTAPVAAIADASPDDQITLPMGDFSVEQVRGLLAVEFLVHAWDVAQAIDVEVPASNALAEATLELGKALLDHTPRSDDGYAEVVPVTEDSSALARLVAATGRQPY
ncbi:TIGR03086 family metal-binding protein [Propionibacteriaceae bacterium Y1685]